MGIAVENKQATIKVTHKDGETIVSNGVVDWKFGGKMLDETVIASIVFQTIYTSFREAKEHSDNFTINFTMEEIINE